MAFQIHTLNTVEFDGVEYRPEINSEMRLRLASLSFDSDSAQAEAEDVLATCFPADKDRVKALLPRVPLLEKQMLRAYLLGGQSAVDIIRSEIINTLGAQNDK